MIPDGNMPRTVHNNEPETRDITHFQRLQNLAVQKTVSIYELLGLLEFQCSKIKRGKVI